MRLALVVAMVAALIPGVLVVSSAPVAQAAPADVTIVAQNLDGTPLSEFTFLVSEDNAGLPNAEPMERPGVKPLPSYIPLVAAGDQDSATVSLENPGRYLVSVKAPGHKLWGQHFSLPLPATANGQVIVQLEPFPLKLGQLVVHAFHDQRPVNAAPGYIDTATDDGGLTEGGLEGFEVRLHDTVGEMQADYNGDPLCGGVCLTDANGDVTIPNLAPGRYKIEVLPPDGTDWLQTTTFEGTHLIDFARVTENDTGLGAPIEGRVQPGVRTTWWFGFVLPENELSCTPPQCGSVTGQAKTWVGWPPFSEIYFGEPVKQAVIALNDIGAGENQVYTDFAAPDGTFTIENIPDGNYMVSIFDENLDYIIRYVTFQLPHPVTGSRDLDLNVEGVNGTGIPVARWFGWHSGFVFEDNGLDIDGNPIQGAEADNGIRDCDAITGVCEEGIDGIDLDLRWRDGSVKSTTFTGLHPETGESGYYEYPELLSPLARFLISEVGFGRFARTGMSLHNELDPSSVEALPDGLGGGLLLNQMTAEGHRSSVDWGKREYVLDDPDIPGYDGEHGGITGIVFYATTRNEFDPSLAAAEDYEPAIPNATVKLWGPGPDGFLDTPDTPSTDDVLVNEVQTDAWSHPRSDHPDEPQSCEVRDAFGATLTGFVPDVAANCLEFPILSNQTKDGAFDGGYAIETMLNDPVTGEPLAEETLLPPGDYNVEVVPPAYYQVIKEEDQNTDEGDELVPQIPPPPCVGQLHLVSDPRNPADGTETPLCNKKLVTLEDAQNPAADFFLFTDVDDDPTTNTAADGSWNTVESVAPPGRIFGFVGDDLRFDTNPTSPWYGQPVALSNIPVGIYDYNGRLMTMLHTDTHGFYDVTLPSTQTYNCPTPSGVCPGMYIVVIDDPSDPAFNPDYLTADLGFDVWPGKTTYADTPVDPISAVSCNLGLIEDPVPNDPQGFLGYQFPELWRVTNDVTTLPEAHSPYVRSTGSDAQRTLTIDGAGFGATRGTGQVTLNGTPLPEVPGTPSPYLSWSGRQIRIRIPSGYTPGAYQLLIRTANGETPAGITLHVFGTGYNLTETQIRHVPTEYPTIQDAVDAATEANGNNMVVVHEGTYNENVIMHKRLKLQGVGPGGSVGSPETGPLGGAIDDIRQSIPGSVIDGRNFLFDRADAWNAKLASLPKPAGFGDVPGGAGITVVPETIGQFAALGGQVPSIDGLGITMSQGGGAGGVLVNAFARRLQIKNNIIENNGGVWGGGIALGLPSQFNPPTGQTLNADRLDNQNDDVLIAYNRLLGNGDAAGQFQGSGGGGVAIYNGAERYTVEQNDICSNYSTQYGGGIHHWGLSGGQTTSGVPGRIRDNRIFGNEAFDTGGGIMIAGEYPPGFIDIEARGSGRVDIERNQISSNLSNDDGGGMMLLDTMGTPTAAGGASRVSIVNNMLTNNAATDVGGGITIDDAHNMTFVNNTVAGNVSTDTAEDFNGLPNGAGFVSEKNSLDAGFSVPVQFFNNIFWDNEAFTFDGTALVSGGNIDLEVYGTPGLLSPRFSLLSTAVNTDGHASNVVGGDPAFKLVYNTQVSVAPTGFAGEFQTSLFRGDPPPPGHDGLPGNYHITAASAARHVGVLACTPLLGCPAPTALAPLTDIDGDARTGAPTPLRFDAGADEWRASIGDPIILP